MKFVCDDNLGRLARWLRTLGFDTVFRAEFCDTDVLTVALNDGRTILTRDTRLADKALARDLILLSSSDPLEQLKDVLHRQALIIQADSVFTRCPCCNTPVATVSKEEAASRIPPYVYRTKDRFTCCTSCGRIYWRGTHVERMIEYLRAAGITIG